MNTKMKQAKKYLERIILLSSLFLMNFQSICYADPKPDGDNKIESSTASTGTQSLFSDVTATLLWLIPVSTIVAEVWLWMKLQHVQDEEAKPITKKMKLVAIAGVGAFVTDGVIKGILSYYGYQAPAK